MHSLCQCVLVASALTGVLIAEELLSCAARIETILSLSLTQLACFRHKRSIVCTNLATRTRHSPTYKLTTGKRVTRFGIITYINNADVDDDAADLLLRLLLLLL